MLKSILSNFDELFKNILVGIEIQNYRNFAEFPFPSKISRADRREIERTMVNIIKKLEPEIFEGEVGKFVNFGIQYNITFYNLKFRKIQLFASKGSKSISTLSWDI